jgi:hypothetical protein
MGTERTCAFCGKASDLTNEHVFPECFRKTVDAITTAKTTGGEKAILSALEIHDVCARCNNGPLSLLDQYFCSLNEQFFSKIVRPGQRVRFEYDFDLLLRMLLKVGYNVARARKWHLGNWRDSAAYILGAVASPLGYRVFLQLIVPTPLERVRVPVSPGTTEVTPLPLRVYLTDVTSSPGLVSAYSVSIWSYRFFVLQEDPQVLRRARERTVSKWLKNTKGAFELSRRGMATVYASSVDVLEDVLESPIFHEQLALARELKSTTELKKTQRRQR